MSESTPAHLNLTNIGRGSNLRDVDTFPPFSGCPSENYINFDYYSVYDGIVRPKRHWCFIGEVEDFSWLFRLSLHVRDVEGQLLYVWFHDEDRGARYMKSDGSCILKGQTITYLYGERHWFMDGTQGFRLEQVDFRRLNSIPSSLTQVLAANDKLHASLPAQTCWNSDCPQVENLMRCSKCYIAYYCGREHQAVAWKEHKAECKILAALRWFKERDWEIYGNCFFFATS